MRGEDPGLVGQVEDPPVQRVVEHAGEPVCCETTRRRSEQVRSAHVADEESVAGESPVGDGIVGVLEDKYAYGLGSVARGRSDL